MRSEPEHDAVIVGSGAGGGALAWALTRAGLRVLVLERGPHYTERDFFHDELTVCRRNFFVPGPLDDPHVVVKAGKAERSAEGWIACCVGGGTVHMSGYFYRLHEEDFRLRTRFGEVPGASVADWPISLDELAPYYDEAERTIGVSGDASANPLEKRGPYPLAPILAHPSSALIEESCAKLGLRAYPTPRAILSADYQGRSACSYCGFCGSYGCEVGAKSSTLASFLALAQKTGRLTLRANATATAVLTDAKGKASSVAYLDEKGRAQEARGRVVAVACSAIETARLLFASESAQHPHGLANSSGLLGRNLMFATFASGYGRLARPSPHFPPSSEVLPFLDRSVQDLYLAPSLAHPKAGTILFQRPHVNPIFQAERLARNPDGAPPAFGAELKRRLREFFHETHTIEWETFSESLPHAGSSVALDGEVKDRAGRRVARIEHSVHPVSLRASDLLAEKARSVLTAAGAVRQGASSDERTYTVLQAGTARMGTEPALSVLDRDCQAHDVKNLYVADSSSFPSSGGAPFTLTIMANALRVGAAIAARAKRREL